MKKIKTFTSEYLYFEPGTLVTPTSHRSSLEYGKTYTVTECHEPRFAGDPSIVFVLGKNTGVSCEYLKEVSDVQTT
jgi:hypothetical protein